MKRSTAIEAEQRKRATRLYNKNIKATSLPPSYVNERVAGYAIFRILEQCIQIHHRSRSLRKGRLSRLLAIASESNEGAAFASYLYEVINRAEFRNFDLYSEINTVIVDRVIRFEDLKNGLAQIANELGCDMPSEMPRAKSQYRLNLEPAREILSPKQRQRIKEICAEEFDLMGYE